MTIKPKISLADFKSLAIEDNEMEETLPIWLREFINDGFVIEKLVPSFACRVIRKFADQLFAATSPVGVLQSDRLSKTWLILGKNNRIPSTVENLARANTGEFFFVSEPKSELPAGTTKPDLLERFMAVFGGLRETIPHFGGNYFNPYSHQLFDEMLTSRVHSQPEWKGSRVFATQNHYDYFVMSRDGNVGYLPFDMEQRICQYSESFEEAIFKWLNTALAEGSPQKLLFDEAVPGSEYRKLFEKLKLEVEALVDKNHDKAEFDTELETLLKKIEAISKQFD